MRIGLSISLLFWLGLFLLLSGCAYNPYTDPNIIWPVTWQVQDNYVTTYCDYRA